MERWDRLAASFIEEYAARGVAEQTVEQMGRELDLCGSWLRRRRARPNLEALAKDVDLLSRYVKSRNMFRSKSTLSSHLSKLRQFGAYLVREQVWSQNPFKWMKGPRLDPRSPLPKRIGKRELDRMFAAAAAHRFPYQRHLTVVVLSLLYGTGMRRGELAQLDVSDWCSDEGLLQVDGRKTGWERTVAAPTVVWRYLESYLPVRHNVLERHGCPREPALLVNARGRRISLTSLSLLVHRCAKRAGIKLGSVHQFRHTCASDLLEMGRSLPEVKEYLGHRVIGTTVRYVHLSSPQRRAAVELHPVNTWLSSGEEVAA
ncbi:MAG: tyrosine-type recombinase/integrase [Planctomycetes bacterium]|nr:tyrosine-type recombinase/integrase [Planctomycetota bacterium]